MTLRRWQAAGRCCWDLSARRRRWRPQEHWLVVVSTRKCSKCKARCSTPSKYLRANGSFGELLQLREQLQRLTWGRPVDVNLAETSRNFIFDGSSFGEQRELWGLRVVCGAGEGRPPAA